MSRSICFLAAFLCVVASAAAICTKDSLKLTQGAIRRTEWKVTIKSECVCSISDVKLLCPKFQAGIKVNPNIISIDEAGHCLLSTRRIFKDDVVEFTYESDRIDFKIFNFNVACS